MSSQNYSMAWTEDESHEDQLFNVGITRKEMEKKISFRLHHILIHLVLGVGLNLADIGGDMYSSVQRYNKQNEGNHTAQNITHQEEGSSWHFPVSVFLLVFPSFVIMSFSLVTYWREEQSKLKLTGWGLLRLACHFPFFLLAPAVRTVDLVILGHECESLKLENLGDELKRKFKLLQKRDETLTRIQHWENSFESGPQLWFKIHLLFLHLSSGQDVWSYGFLNVFFIGIGISSCAWKSVCNRKSLNLCNDQEKRMSWRKHIIPLLIAHSLSVFTRFTLLGALSALSLPWFGFFFVIHVIFVFYYLVIWGALLNLAQNGDSCWNPTENIIRLTNILTSSLFSFVEFSVLTEKKWRKRIYYWIPMKENVMLIIICSSMTPMPLALSISVGVALLVSARLLYICEDFQLESTKRNPVHNNIRSHEEVGDTNAGTQTAAPVHSVTGSLGYTYSRDNIGNPDMVLSHRRPPPPKEWKDMNELLSDDDLLQAEKDAIRRKDLNWICQEMKSNVFQVLTLMLTENGDDVTAAEIENRMTPTLQLCKYYNKEDLPKILEFLINKGADVKAVNDIGETMLHLVCEHYSHRNLKDIVDLLIKKGVPVDAKDFWGHTALHCLAGSYEHDNLEEVVRLLIDNGARLDVLNDAGFTPLMELCGNDNKLKHIKVFSLLTPDARDDPHLPGTQSVTRLLEEFDEKKISPKDFEDGLERISENVSNKYWQWLTDPPVDI